MFSLRKIGLLATTSVFLFPTVHFCQSRGVLFRDILPLLVLTSACCWAFYRAVIYPHFLSSLRHLPTAPVSRSCRDTSMMDLIADILKTSKTGIPLIGYGFAQFSRSSAFLKLMKSVPNSGIIRYFSFLNTEYLLLTNSQALSEVLVRRPYDFEKSPAVRNLIRRFTGSKILAAEGEEHKHIRKNMRPAFQFRKIKDLYPIFWAKAICMSKDIHASAPPDDNGSITGNIVHWVERAMLDTIGRAVFGLDVNDTESRNQLLKLFATGGSTGLDLKLLFMASAFLPRWTLQLIPGGINKRIDSAHEGARVACEAFLDERKRDSQSENHKDILSQLIQSNSFTDEELADQILSLLAAGFEPTSAAFSWVIWYLIQYPQWQARLRTEIKTNILHRFFRDASSEFDVAVLDDLPVLNAVCNESLRFMPPSPLISRQARIDTTILGHQVPKGTRLLISPFAINHFDESYGTTAGVFDPGRWLNDDGSANTSGGARDMYAFMTFLHGPRKCVGDLYARANVRAFVACIVGCFEFELADGGEVPVPGGILSVKPKGGIEVKLRPVDPW